MDAEHPRETATFAGAQLRYLIKSAHGYLGAVGMLRPAWRMRLGVPPVAWRPKRLCPYFAVKMKQRAQ